MFAGNKIFLMLIVAALLVLGACQSISTNNVGEEVSIEGGSYRAVSVQELQTLLENKDFTMINVHTPWQGDIPQTDSRLAYDQISESPDQLPADKDAKILVYCLTSGMAKKAVESLVNLGYTNIWMLDGGTTAWEEAGLTLEKE
jgi:rhodanese-related sulfurtransferase